MRIDEFVLARVAEDEVVARSAIADGEGARDWAGTEGATDAHIARHDPARVLAECAAKRAILADHTPADDGRCGLCSDLYCVTPWDGICDVARPLAAVYADHPDYDPAWAW